MPKVILTRCRILYLQSGNLQMLFHFILVSIVSDEKCAIIEIASPHISSIVFLWIFYRFKKLVFSFLKFDDDGHIYLNLSYLKFPELRVSMFMFVAKISKYSAVSLQMYFLHYILFTPLLGCDNMSVILLSLGSLLRLC